MLPLWCLFFITPLVSPSRPPSLFPTEALTNQSELDLWKQDKPIPRNVAWLKKINKYQGFKDYQNMQAILGHGSDYNLIHRILHTFSRMRRRAFQSLSGSINLKKQLISCLLSTHTRKHSKPNSWAEEVRCNGCKVIKRYYLVYLWVNKNIPIGARMTIRYAAERQTTVDHKWLHWWNDHTFVVFPYIITLSRLPLYSLRRVFNGGRFLCIAPLLAL